MKLKRLNTRGFSHDVLLVAFVVIFAIIGVGYLVASHAEDCNQSASGPTSDDTSGVDASGSSTCQPASAPVTPIATLIGVCDIGNLPAKLKYKQTYYPNVTYVNTGTTTFTPSGSASLIPVNSTHKQLGGKGGPVVAPSLTPGLSETVPTGLAYTVPHWSQKTARMIFEVTNTSPSFSCSTELQLPT